MKQLLLIGSLLCGGFITAFSQDSLQQYVGKYSFPEGSVVREITVSVENNSLLVGSLLGTTSLVKEADDNFTLPALNGVAMFKRDSNKKITNVKIDLNGLKMEGVKDNDMAATGGGSADKPIIIIWETKLLTGP